MKTQIVKIGNSQGIRIPKIILEQSRIGTDVELIAEHEQIIIRSAKKTRDNWGNTFKKMAEHGDDQLFDEEPENSWDETEWQWDKI